MTQYYNTIQNSVKTLMLAVLSLLQTRQESKKTTTWKATLQKKNAELNNWQKQEENNKNI